MRQVEALLAISALEPGSPRVIAASCPYIVDFVCLEQKLIIELGGSQHASDPDDPGREAFLRRSGYRVLRFWNNEVLKHTAAVCESILREMSVNPAPAGCEGQAEGC